MEIVKKFVFYVIAVAIIAGAGAFYFLVVGGIAAKYEANLKSIEGRRDKLKGFSNEALPNDRSIEAARQRSELIKQQLTQCNLYLARQPRLSHTRRFIRDEILGRDDREIDQSLAWQDEYNRRYAELRRQLDEAGFQSFATPSLSNLWGEKVPNPGQITAAMEQYWYQKDMADFLTEQAEKDLTEYLKLVADRPDFFPAKPSDLVINRKPAVLEELLRGFTADKLRDVFSAIIVNEKQQDLALIFNNLMADETKKDGTVVDGMPWTRPATEAKISVLNLTMDDVQRAFVAAMVPPEKEDILNRQRFVDYITEMRAVRYRSDVIGLLEAKGFEDVALRLRRNNEEERARLMQEIANWSSAKLAQAIGAVVSLRDEKDYRLVRANHSPMIVELGSIELRSNVAAALPTGGAGAGAAAGRRPGNDMYYVNTFTMKVKLDFERVPIFLRRLLNNSWRYRIEVTNVTPTEGGRGASARPVSGGGAPGMPGMPGMPAMPGMPGMPGMPTQAGGAGVPSAAGAAADVAISVRKYVWVELQGEAYQFVPLREKYKKELASIGQPAPAPAPATTPAPASAPAPAPAPAGTK